MHEAFIGDGIYNPILYPELDILGQLFDVERFPWTLLVNPGCQGMVMQGYARV